LILEAAPSPPQEIIRRRVGRNAHPAGSNLGRAIAAELQATFSRPQASQIAAKPRPRAASTQTMVARPPV
jgi:hypothetical protein